MPALTLPAPIGCPLQVGYLEPTPEPQGVEGKKVLEAAEAVRRHWYERSEHLLSAGTSTETFSYEPVPLETAFSIRVRYEYGRELKPLPYPIDE
jgi:hypothetical protein